MVCGAAGIPGLREGRDTAAQEPMALCSGPVPKWQNLDSRATAEASISSGIFNSLEKRFQQKRGKPLCSWDRSSSRSP